MRTDAITINIIAGIVCMSIYLLRVHQKNLGFNFYNLLHAFCYGPGIVTGILLIVNELFFLNPKYVINKRFAVAIGGVVLTCFAVIGLLKTIGIELENITVAGMKIANKDHIR